MSVATEATIYLFSYGTLQDKAVQIANFGRELSGSADAMLGYDQHWVEITDPEVLATSGKTHHPILRPGSADSAPIAGMVFQITPQELAAADSYEVSDYKRVSVSLASGIEAWVYVSA
ncbi:gamma-glutamylcyclotransferase [Pseudomonas sp. Fl5BN2]|uniref:gamma-glutamylcyclotransferase family protein n=1 Tax=unclassified Pseudomonas TaxID=196821 RepID=UPI0013782AE7|nr:MULTISPECIES: gamma-glutamylcyclotransferase family protein [unclassified Pseudomonas]NBF03619.1 gamma-glutamylcyclotransferase [Pseudomonas sp. Fl5BN2]NBF12508.1 gamma-glutamylcyclotransferase [Pseudomonas sp. Fl4BN1]